MSNRKTIVYRQNLYHDPDPEPMSDGDDTNNRTTQLNKGKSPNGLPAPPYTPIDTNPDRGDIQPFIALGLALQRHGHRVRIATHDVFDKFVTSSGLGFHPVGGDPAELMAYMVSSPRLVPDLATLRASAIARKRHMYEVMLQGFWESCLADDHETGAPFVADAIIANPPSFAHVHCAEALGVPCHFVFTMPWSSTGAFAPPLAGLTLDAKGKKKESKSTSSTNFVSYSVVNLLTWQGLGDIGNHWRVETLDLEAVPSTEGPHLIESLKVPFTYCWSPSLVAKPLDWGEHIVPKPIYIGFGSIVVGDAEGLMSMVLSAVKTVGVRAIISRGWSNLAADESDDIFFVGDCPHEWLFQQVAAVVHHGGAGTTACGLRYGCPTSIVPFFGDQPFWGTVVNAAGAGPPLLPYDSLTSQKLAQAIEFCLLPTIQEAASVLACQITAEDGVQQAVDSFHRNLPQEKLQCDFFSDETAVWAYGHDKRQVKMCRGVATILRRHGADLKNLKLLRTGNIDIENRRWDPFTAVSAASLSTAAGFADATVDVVRKPIQYYRRERKQVDIVAPDDGASAGAAAIPSGAAMPPLVDTDVLLAADKSSRKQDAVHLNALPEESLRPASKSSLETTSATSSKSAKFRLQGERRSVGVFVDIPLAATEGMRAGPQLWGEDVERHEHVRDVRSGVCVSGRSFYGGITGAVKGVFLRTYEAKRRQGAVTGLMSYPAQGVAKSIRARMRGEARRRITDARWREGEWLLDGGGWSRDTSSLLHDFEGLKGRRV
ncbi:hypothetical protein LQW54_008126 [Pestalotiopsis sp. IQ-011]